MERSPVLPSYPVFIDTLKNCANGYDFFTAIAGAMVFLLGHEPDAAVNAQYCEWLRIFNGELASQLFYEGTEMTARNNFPQAVWMLQASLLLEPESYETNYNLALTFNQLATKLMREEKFREAGDCYKQAEQYFKNAEQLKDNGAQREDMDDYAGGDPEIDEGYDTGIHREWQG
jgi:tetratricopeptide (TPR) repeat protein